MKRTTFVTALLTLWFAVLACPDTVTTKQHLSVNGDIKQVAGGVITLEAIFSSGPKSWPIPITTVESIEFNAMKFNPGAPARTFGLGPPAGAPPRTVPEQAMVLDTILLRGGNREPCRLVSIDTNLVRCKGNGKAEATYSRKIVLRILLGGDR